MEIEKSLIRIKQYLRQNDKKAALSILKKKKNLDRVLSKREKSLENSLYVFETIQSSENDFEVFNAMKEGSKKLRELSNQVEDGGLQETISNLNYRWANSEEIKNTIQENLNEAIDLSEVNDLTKELENLEIPNNKIHKDEFLKEDINDVKKVEIKINKDDLNVERHDHNLNSYDNKDIQVIIENSN